MIYGTKQVKNTSWDPLFREILKIRDPNTDENVGQDQTFIHDDMIGVEQFIKQAMVSGPLRSVF